MSEPTTEADALPGEDSERGPGLESARPAPIDDAHLKNILESLIFVSDRPVPARRLSRVARVKVAEVRRVIGDLIEAYAERGIELIEVAGGYQFRSAPANAAYVREVVGRRPVRLTRAQLETLAIAAYRQPLTRPELEDIRGVDSGSALKVLLERGLLKLLGRRDEPGRPLLYGTSPAFLEFFGLKGLDELPSLKEFTELSDESKELFARRTGEAIESVADIEIEAAEYDESEFEDLDDAEVDSKEDDSDEGDSDEDDDDGDSDEGDSDEGDVDGDSDEDDSDEDDDDDDSDEDDDD